MAKVFTYTIILVTIIMVLSLMGFETNSSALLQNIGLYNSTGDTTLEQIKTEDNWLFGILFSSALGIIALASLVTAVSIGFFGSKPEVNLLLAGFVVVLAGWIVGDMIKIYLVLNNYFTGDWLWMAGIFKLIIIILITGFLISIVEWWKGSD